MRAILLLALAGWMHGGSLRYHFVDGDGKPFQLRLPEPVPTVQFTLPAPPQRQRLLLRVNVQRERAPHGRYEMGYPIPESLANAGILAGGATLLGTILADFLTHSAPVGR